MGTDPSARRTLEAWLEVIDHATYYELLGVDADADADALREAFHRFSSYFHPDVHRHAADQRELATRIYRRGAEAYGVLRDRQRRAAYDLAVATGHLRLHQEQRSGAGTAQSLSDLCQTPGGRLHATRAARLLDANDLDGAWHALLKALSAEGDNPPLKERLNAVQALRSAR